MTQLRWIAVSLIAAFPLAALAQSPPQQPDPLDPKASVSAPGYVSAFAGYVPATVGEQASPDKTWRASNDNVAQSGGHAGHAAAVPAAPAPAAQREPAAATAPIDHSHHAPGESAVKASSHADHSKHSPVPEAPKKAIPADHSKHPPNPDASKKATPVDHSSHSKH